MKALADLNKPVQVMIKLATGLPLNRVIKSGQDKPLPKGNSCFYKLTAVRTIGAPFKLDTPVDATETTLEDWKDKEEVLFQKLLVNASLHFYGDKANDNALIMKRCNHRHGISRHLFDSKIQWSGAGNPDDLSDLIQGETQQRFHLDINLVVDVESTPELILMAHSVRFTFDDS